MNQLVRHKLKMLKLKNVYIFMYVLTKYQIFQFFGFTIIYRKINKFSNFKHS